MKLCSIEGCVNKHCAKGLCASHSAKKWRKMNPDYKKEYYWKNHERILKVEYARRKKNSAKFKEYQKNWHKKYYENHKTKLIQYSNKWQKEHRKHLREWSRKNYLKNREKILASQKNYKWWKKYPDRARETRKRWRMNNKDKFNEWTKKWKEENREKLRFYYRKSRIKRKSASGSHTLKEWIEIKKKANGICKGWKKEPHYVGFDKLTQDHIIPLSLNGTDYASNLQPLCLKCNIKKWAHTE